MTDSSEQPIPEQIADAIQQSEYPELSVREVMDQTGLLEDQVVTAAGSMDRLEVDRSLGVVRLCNDDGGEFNDDHSRDVLPDGGVSQDPNERYQCPICHEHWDEREEAEKHTETHPGLKPYMVVVI